MEDERSSTQARRTPSNAWALLAITLFAGQAVSLPFVKTGASLTAYSNLVNVVHFLVLLLATGIITLNAVQSRQAIRLFWSFLALGCALWAVNASMWVYHVAMQGDKHPDFLSSAGPLYLHIIFLIAAVAARPHLKLSRVKPYQTTLNLLFLLFFFVFAYALVLVPAAFTQYSLNILRAQAVYSAENLVLLVALGAAAMGSRPPWKVMYWHLLVASMLYAIGSLAANLAVGSGRMSAGWYSLFYVAAAYWFLWIALLGRERAPQLAETIQFDGANPKYASTLAMLAVIAIPIVGVWELFRPDQPYATHVLRLLIVFCALLSLAITAFITEYITKRELSSDVVIAHDRLRMAMASGKSVGWEWDIASGLARWFGDLQTMFSISSDTFSGSAEDFYRYVHHDDRKRVSDAVTDARVNHKHYEAEFRIVRQDGVIRWVSARGAFHYAKDGNAERMLGMAVDITDRRLAEDALKNSEEKFAKAFRRSPMAITLTSVLDHRYLDVNETFEQLTGWQRDEVIGRTPSDLGIWADPTQRLEYVKELQTKSFVRDKEVLYRRKNGEQGVGLGSGELIEVENEPCVLSVIADITERKKVQEKLHDSEERLSNIITSARDAIIATDEEQRVVLFNPAAEKMFGCAADQAIGSSIDRFIPQRFRAAHQAHMRLFSELGAAARTMGTLGTLWGIRVSGEEFPIEASISHVDGTQTKMFMIIIRDVTERQRTEEALREGEERYRRLVENISDAVMVDDAAGRVVFANERFLRLFGLRRDQLADLKLEDYVTSECVKEVRDRHNRRMRGESAATHFEYEGLQRDGTRMWIEVDVVPVADETGKVIGTQSALRDVTARKKAENTIRESEERFRVVANTAPVMLWMAGLDKLCNYVNQTWLKFTGRPLEAELGNGWTEAVHPDDLNRCLDTYRQAFDRQVSFQMQYRVRRYDGEYRWLADLGVPRFTPDGSFAGYIGSCVDVTDRKLAEESLATIGRRLIEAHEEERTWIARELHDDVNQRIALLAIELERWNQQLPESAADHYDHIRHARQRLSDISKDIQALSHRLHSSKLEYLGIVAAANSFCKEISEQQKVSVEFTHSDIPRTLPMEISLSLFRVLQEALRNAVKHSGARHFSADLRGTKDEIRLTVSDAGVGFDFQAAMKGRGLGLISMRERLQLVQGEFSVESEPGQGTTIFARVPLRADEHRGIAV